MSAGWLLSFSTESAQAVNDAAGALMAGLWRACFQGALLGLAVWCACRVFTRLPAAARFALWWLVCAKLVVGLALCLVALPLPILPTHPSGAPLGQWILNRLAPPDRIVAAPRREYRVATRTEPPANTPEKDAAPIPARPSASTALIPSPSAPVSSPVPLSLAALLTGIYLAGVLGMVAFHAWGAFAVRRLLRDAQPVELPSEEIDAAARAAGLRPGSVPRFASSAAVTSPLVSGLLRPVIVLPPGFAQSLTATERRMALAHEMAHLRRGDLWLALIPALARILFFFFPVAYLAARECAACREEACDLIALEAGDGGAPTAAMAGYGRLLLRTVAGQKRTSTNHTAAGFTLGMAAPGFPLLRRRLLALQKEAGRPTSLLLRATALVLTAVSAVGILPWRLTPLLATPNSTTPGEGAPPLPLYELTDLGTLGGKYSDAFDISEDGAVVGTANIYPQGGMGHAFLFHDGKMADLSRGSIYRHSLAYGVNSSGQVVASAYRSSYRTTAQYAFVWNGRKRVYLGSLPGFGFSKAVGINDRNQVIGNALTGRTDDEGATASRAFLWEAGRMRDLGTLGGPHSHAYSIGEEGQVVGKADLPPVNEDAHPAGTHAFLWQQGAMRDLGTLPGGQNSLAYDVNRQGAVVGYSQTASAATRAFLWQDGAMRDMGALPSHNTSVAYGLNDEGAAVGLSSGDSSAPGRAVLWLPTPTSTGSPIDLNTRLAANTEGWVLETARAINNRGQIVGQGIVDGQRRAFLLTPIPQPAADKP